MDTNPERDEFDYVVLAGVRSPGKAEVSGGKLTVNYDEQAGQGIDGATLQYKGVGLGELDVKFTLWEDEHWLEWETFRELLKPPKAGVQPTAMDLRHPCADELGVNAVVMLERSQIAPDGDTGAWSMTVKFKSYRKPKPILGGNVNGSIDKPTPDDPLLPRNALLDSLNAKADALDAEDAATP